MTIDLNENLETLLEKIGQHEKPRTFVFSWVSKDVGVPTKRMGARLEQDFSGYYRQKIDPQKYYSWRESNPRSSEKDPFVWTGDGWFNLIERYICEALINAGTHGYGISKFQTFDSKIRRRIRVRVYYGERGIIYSIRDPGKGFKVDEALKEARARRHFGLELSIHPLSAIGYGRGGFKIFDWDWVYGTHSQYIPDNTIVSWNYKGKSPPVGDQRKGNERYGNNILISHLFHPEVLECFK